MKPTPRLALSVTSKPSFIFKRIESLMQWGKDPFHPRRGQLAGVAVCLGIVAVMVALFGQPMLSSHNHYADKLQKSRIAALETLKIAEGKIEMPKSASIPSAMSFHEMAKHDQKITHDSVMVLIQPIFYINGNTEQVSVSRHGYRPFVGFIIVGKGLFVFSLKPFAGASKAGFVKDNTLSFHVGQYEVQIENQSPILVKDQFRGKSVPIYAKLDAQYNKNPNTPKPLPRYKQNVANEIEGSPYFVLFEAFDYEEYYKQMDKPALSLWNPNVNLNGEGYNMLMFNGNMAGGEMGSVCDCDLIYFHKEDGALFALSAQPFDQAQPIAIVKGNTLSVPTPEGLMTITSSEDILLQHSGKIWFAYKKGVEGLYEPFIPTRHKSVFAERYTPNDHFSWDKFMVPYVFDKDVTNKQGQHATARRVIFSNKNEEI
jgi:hypothetical protein